MDETPPNENSQSLFQQAFFMRKATFEQLKEMIAKNTNIIADARKFVETRFGNSQSQINSGSEKDHNAV